MISPGTYPKMSNEEYHADKSSISKSGLDVIARSPAHYWAKYIDPNAKPQESTPAMRLGSLVHCVVLEPNEVSARYVVEPESAPRKPTAAQINAKKQSDDTISAIEYWHNFAADNVGKEIVSADDMGKALAMRTACMDEPEIAAALSLDGDAEMTFVAKDPETGVILRCRFDWLTHDLFALDLKTTRDIRNDEFGKSIWGFRYHVQQAFYSDVFRLATGDDLRDWAFGAIESEAPHFAVPVRLPDDMVQYGRMLYRKDLRRYADCLSSGKWPGPAPKPYTFSPRGWMLSEIEAAFDEALFGADGE